MKHLGLRGELVILAVIMVVGVFFRTFRFDTVPGGLTDDEALWGFQATRVANGEIRPIFFEEKFGREPIYGYLVALVFSLFGPSIPGVRAVAALVGIATIPIFYCLVKELFPQEGPCQGSLSLIAVLSTAWLSTSYWHVIYSRSGIAPILLPLFVVSTFYLLWRGLKSARLVFFLCAGFFLGASVYTYQAGRFLPIFTFLFLLYLAWRDGESIRRHWVNIVLLFGVCAVVVLPLAFYALNHSEIFLRRAEAVSIFSLDFNQGSPVKAFGIALAKAAAMFSFEGDHWPERNPGGRPILDPLTSVWFLIGLCITLLGSRHREYAFTWSWFVVMSLPVTLTISEIPNFTRAIGALPVVYIFPAIAVARAYQYVEKRLASTRLRAISATVVFGTPLLLAALMTYRDYFGAYDRRDDLPRQADVTLIEAASLMNQMDMPGAVWIWPTTSPVSGQHIFSHPDFLYRGTAPYHFLSCDESTAPDDLTRICQDASKALVFEWKEYVAEKAYEAMAADPKSLLPFLLQKYGSETDRSSYEAFDVVTYRLPESPAFSIAESFEPLTVNFGDELLLAGMAFGGSSLQDTSTPQEVDIRRLPSGKTGWVVLRWRALRVPSRNYKVAVYLQDEGEHLAGQVDKLLLSNHLHPTQDWEAGQEEIDYYSLPSWSGTAPGLYEVGVTVYDAETLKMLGAVGAGQTHSLGMMEIVRPLMAGDVEPEVRIEPYMGGVAPGIRLVGYDLPRRAVNPGDKVNVALYWQALEDVSRNYLIALQLTDEQGQVWAEKSDPPVYGTYATTQWIEKETLKDWHDLSLPAEMPQGSYQLSVLIAEDDRLLHEEILDTIGVGDRARQFTIPEIQHPTEARFGEATQFLGYDLSSDELTAGGTLELTLYWQALQGMETSYTVFTHLLDAEEHIWGQMDSIPGRGTAPTTSWVESEIVTDEYEFVVDPAAPAGEYAIEIGMYDATTGERLPVYATSGELQGDRALLEPIRVSTGG